MCNGVHCPTITAAQGILSYLSILLMQKSGLLIASQIWELSDRYD